MKSKKSSGKATREELIFLLRDLWEWHNYMGGWEDKSWKDVKLFLKQEGYMDGWEDKSGKDVKRFLKQEGHKVTEAR